MSISSVEVKEAYPVEEGVVNILRLSCSSEETDGGYLKQVIPYILAGYEHVVVDCLLDTWIATEPLELTTGDKAEIKRSISPGTYVTLANGTKVAVYDAEIE
ncbi:hypothetical protein SHANETTE_10 [Bacillus phage Shanette]|uniref:Uncharacterized protein n=1 Tax=Bacillus phage Shanette TaxID=1296656 RepID=S5MBE2_9CAUD|nr:hypothetical protein AVV46_gp010 [Bacillus phage Shanette]AGR47119.1 hypothetical protein SHANETTE_10 [Bacillus phage Shanette]